MYWYQKRNFSLAELIIVSVSLSLLSLAIYFSLSRGIKLWQRLNSKIKEEEVVIFLDKFSREIRSIFNHQIVNFLGEENRIEFPSLTFSPQFGFKSVGKIVYFFEKNNLCKEEFDYSGIYSKKPFSQKIVLNEINLVRFFYYGYNQENKTYFWQNFWKDKQLPLAVRVEIFYKNKIIKNTFYLPVKSY